MVSTQHELRAVELSAAAAASRALLSSLNNTVALDWRRDRRTNTTHVYWTDLRDNKIYTGQLLDNG